MNCDCISRINELLADNNVALDTTIVLGKKLDMAVTLSIGTHWKDITKKPRGKKPTQITVTYCPFCGTKVTDTQE